jgi:hypothetical protein
MYYLRSRPAADPIKFTLEVKKGLTVSSKENVEEACRRKRSAGEECLSCGA